MNQIRRHREDMAELDQISAIVREFTLPDFVEGFALRSGYDQQDEPAVWIVLHASRELPPEQDEADRWVTELNTVIAAIRDRILDAELVRYPYFRVEPAASSGMAR